MEESNHAVFERVKPRPVIVDTDADFDDLIALAWLLKSNEVDIKAIIYTGTGWSHAPYGARNICHFLNYIGYKNIPVYLGSRIHLSNTSNVSEPRRNAADKLWGTSLPKSLLKYRLGGIDKLTTLLLNHPGPIEYFCIGPLTTLARAILKNSAVSNKIEQLFVMGGAPHTTAYITGFTGNARIDLMATDIVYNQNLAITALTRDTARSLPIDDYFIDTLVSYRQHELINFIYQMIRRVLKYEKQHGGKSTLFVWDLVAAIVFVFPHLAKRASKKIHFIRDDKGVYTDIIIGKSGGKINVVNDLHECYNLIDIAFSILTTSK